MVVGDSNSSRGRVLRTGAGSIYSERQEACCDMIPPAEPTPRLQSSSNHHVELDVISSRASRSPLPRPSPCRSADCPCCCPRARGRAVAGASLRRLVPPQAAAGVTTSASRTRCRRARRAATRRAGTESIRAGRHSAEPPAGTFPDVGEPALPGQVVSTSSNLWRSSGVGKVRGEHMQLSLSDL